MLLPWDVIVDILSRLPAKCLLRFRCVSKKFLSLIDGKDFIYLHLNRSIDTNSNLNLILSRSSMKQGSVIHSLSLDSLDNCVEIARECGECMIDVIGSCNGLLALQTYSKGTILLNPSTNELLELHKLYDHHELRVVVVFGGIGYDVGGDDYKLVKIALIRYPVKHTEVTVYSLKNNSCRKIEDFPYHFDGDKGSGAFVNGAMHWPAKMNPEGYRDDLLLAFDLNSEEFDQVPLPLTVGNAARLMRVFVLGGCLSLACKYDTGMDWDIFVMKDYGMKESWTKIFTLVEGVIDHCLYVKALAFFRSGYKVLMVDSRNANLCWYDIEKQKVESGFEFDVEGIAHFDNGIVCVDSLVSLYGYRDLYWGDLERLNVDSVLEVDDLEIF